MVFPRLSLTSRAQAHGQPPIARLHSHLPLAGHAALARPHRRGDQGDEGEPRADAVLAVRGQLHPLSLTPRRRALAAFLCGPTDGAGPVSAAAARAHDLPHRHLRREPSFSPSLLAQRRFLHQEEHSSRGDLISRAHPASGPRSASDAREARARVDARARVAEPRGGGGGPALRGEGGERQATHGAHRQPRAARPQRAQEASPRGNRHQSAGSSGGLCPRSNACCGP